MKIDRNLNLVIPLEWEGGKIYVHAAPIGTEVFDRYFRVFSKTFAVMMHEGGAITGPRLAARYLNLACQDAEDDTYEALMAEIRRLCNVIMVVDGAWKNIPLEDAINRKILDAEDTVEVSNAICFFTLVWHMLPRSDVRDMLDGASKMWGALITSSSLSEYRNGLPTLTPTAPIGEKALPSSIPS